MSRSDRPPCHRNYSRGNNTAFSNALPPYRNFKPRTFPLVLGFQISKKHLNVTMKHCNLHFRKCVFKSFLIRWALEQAGDQVIFAELTLHPISHIVLAFSWSQIQWVLFFLQILKLHISSLGFKGFFSLIFKEPGIQYRILFFCNESCFFFLQWKRIWKKDQEKVQKQIFIITAPKEMESNKELRELLKI